MITILTGNRIRSCGSARVENGDLWMPGAEVERVTGSAPPEACPRDGDANVSAAWRDLQRPVLSDATGAVWVLGASARERAAALETLVAPDFTLPDLAGKPYSLSDHRGRKVFLASWSSW